MFLLPPKPGLCPLCAVEHPPDAAHNHQSLFYQMRFKLAHGRSPTWADAIAHCDQLTRDFWIMQLQEHYSAPPAGVSPIAEPPPPSREPSEASLN